MDETQIKNLIAASGEELAGLVSQRFVSKIGDDLAVIVGKAQRAQGGAEQATDKAKRELGEAQRQKHDMAESIRTARLELAQLTSQRDAARAELEDLQPRVEKLRDELKRHSRAALDIVAEDNPS